MKFSIVVVLYNKKVTALPIYPILKRLLNADIPVLCYDNSQIEQEVPFAHPLLTYYHDPRNLGLTPGYNMALESAIKSGQEGILLLDHDSNFDFSFIEKLLEIPFNPKVGAIVPKVVADGSQISPILADRYISSGYTVLKEGVYKAPYMAINSGSLINVKALEKIGGFNEEFPLDFLDHWLFWRLGKEDYYLKVLDYAIDHDLSVLDYKKVSHNRYESILTGESKFYSKYETTFLAPYKKQLLKRTIKQLLTVHDSFFWKRTLKAFRKMENTAHK